MQPSARRVALVTGAASGIGAAIAARLRADGIDVFAVDRAAPGDSGGGDSGADSLVADLSTRAGNRAAIDGALARFGRLDIIVASAGFQHVSPIEEFDEDRWDALLAVLLTSPFLLAKYGWAALRAAPDGGRFIVIASAHALVASPYKAGYVAAKHGVLGLIKTLALEGAADGISSVAICPAYVRTPLVENQIAAQALAHGLPEDQVLADVILASQPVKRLIEPEEVADVAAFLVGPTGPSFTGTAMTMDYGWTAR
jgi:3-hydroxybutyrate dehydrogenase